MEICGRDGRSSRRGSNKRMECKGRPKWRDAPLTKKAPYKPYAGKPPVRFGGRGGQKPSLPLSKWLDHLSPQERGEGEEPSHRDPHLSSKSPHRALPHHDVPTMRRPDVPLP